MPKTAGYVHAPEPKDHPAKKPHRKTAGHKSQKTWRACARVRSGAKTCTLVATFGNTPQHVPIRAFAKGFRTGTRAQAPASRGLRAGARAQAQVSRGFQAGREGAGGGLRGPVLRQKERLGGRERPKRRRDRENPSNVHVERCMLSAEDSDQEEPSGRKTPGREILSVSESRAHGRPKARNMHIARILAEKTRKRRQTSSLRTGNANRWRAFASRAPDHKARGFCGLTPPSPRQPAAGPQNSRLLCFGARQAPGPARGKHSESAWKPTLHRGVDSQAGPRSPMRAARVVEPEARPMAFSLSAGLLSQTGKNHQIVTSARQFAHLSNTKAQVRDLHVLRRPPSGAKKGLGSSPAVTIW